MDTSSEVILSVSCAIGGALLGAYAAYLFTKRIEKRKAAEKVKEAAREAQRRLANAEVDRIQVVWQACKSLRRVTDEWYREIRDAIDPSQSPGQIVARVGKLFLQWRYEGEIDDLRKVIEVEPACRSIIDAYEIWKQEAYQAKEPEKRPGRVYINVALDPSIDRLYEGHLQNNPEARRQYLEAVQARLFGSYSTFNDALNNAIDQLSTMEAEARKQSLMGLNAAGSVT